VAFAALQLADVQHHAKPNVDLDTVQSFCGTWVKVRMRRVPVLDLILPGTGTSGQCTQISAVTLKEQCNWLPRHVAAWIQLAEIHQLLRYHHNWRHLGTAYAVQVWQQQTT
jgi:hypothetical protein